VIPISHSGTQSISLRLLFPTLGFHSREQCLSQFKYLDYTRSISSSNVFRRSLAAHSPIDSLGVRYPAEASPSRVIGGALTIVYPKRSPTFDSEVSDACHSMDKQLQSDYSRQALRCLIWTLATRSGKSKIYLNLLNVYLFCLFLIK